MLESFRNKKIMIVVAHPDDELLGLGATINKLVNNFKSIIKVVILGEGITSRSTIRDVKQFESELLIHKNNIQIAKNILGYQLLEVYDFPDNRFDSVPLIDLIKVIEKEKNKFNPEIIFTHHGGDLNIDHQRTFEAVMTACRPMESECMKKIITFETPSGTEWRANSDPRHFLPNFFIEVELNQVKAKIEAMESYEFEARKFPHPRSPEALEILAKRWGIVVGKQFAEAFQIIRIID